MRVRVSRQRGACRARPASTALGRGRAPARRGVQARFRGAQPVPTVAEAARALRVRGLRRPGPGARPLPGAAHTAGDGAPRAGRAGARGRGTAALSARSGRGAARAARERPRARRSPLRAVHAGNGRRHLHQPLLALRLRGGSERSLRPGAPAAGGVRAQAHRARGGTRLRLPERRRGRDPPFGDDRLRPRERGPRRGDLRGHRRPEARGAGHARARGRRLRHVGHVRAALGRPPALARGGGLRPPGSRALSRAPARSASAGRSPCPAGRAGRARSGARRCGRPFPPPP